MPPQSTVQVVLQLFCLTCTTVKPVRVSRDGHSARDPPMADTEVEEIPTC